MKSRSSTTYLRVYGVQSCLLDHQINQICSLKRHKEGWCAFISFMSPKCLGQYTHVRAKTKPVFWSKRLALVDDKSNEQEEIALAKPVFCSNGTVSKAIIQNSDQIIQAVGLIYFKDPLICSHARSHIDRSLDGPIQEISYLVLLDSYSVF